MHLVYPPLPPNNKKKIQNSFLLRISPGYSSHPSHVMVMQNLGWRGRGGGGKRCIMAYVKMVNSELYPEPLFQSEAKCEAIEMTATLLMQIKLIVTRKVLHLCSF